MLNNYFDTVSLTAVQEKTLTITDSLLYVLFGISFVIITLGIICVVVLLLLPLFNKISKSIDKKKEKKNAVAPEPETKVEAAPIVEQNDNSDVAIVAAIIAAIAASENKTPNQFRVVSFKKI